MMLKNILFLAVTILKSHGKYNYPSLNFQRTFCTFLALKQIPESDWNGKWFPHSPGESDSNPVYVESVLHDSRHGIKMGVVNDKCDDAKVILYLLTISYIKETSTKHTLIVL